jgi:dephospho-CoA kinase
MIKVGLTGNIGSGKSLVTSIFETLGVPVFHADEVAKTFLTDKSVQIAIKEKFGESVFNGEIPDRKKLAYIVFNNRDALAFLNSLIHPKVRQELMRWFDQNAESCYVIEEAAILFESSLYREFDKIIMVAAPVELAIRRVMQRDGIGKEKVKKRLINQWQQEKKIELSDYVIINDENHLVIPQVMAIHKELTQ